MGDLLDAKDYKSYIGGPSFSLRHRAIRMLWNITWMFLASWTPPPMHGWRRFLLRIFGAKISKTARIYGSTRVWYPPNLEMGDYSIIGWEALCYCQSRVVLEDFAVISQRAHICTGSHEIDHAGFQLISREIVIKRYAWIAADAFVGPGVCIGEGAVLGGRGVTFKSLEPWAVYVGNPARKMRNRNNISQEMDELMGGGVVTNREC